MSVAAPHDATTSTNSSQRSCLNTFDKPEEKEDLLAQRPLAPNGLPTGVAPLPLTGMYFREQAGLAQFRKEGS